MTWYQGIVFLIIIISILIIIIVLIITISKTNTVKSKNKIYNLEQKKHKKPILFIHNSKCGGTTICHMCKINNEICGTANCNISEVIFKNKNREMVEWWKYPLKKIYKMKYTVYSIEFLKILPDNVLNWIKNDDFKSIICIREPISRYISAIEHKCNINNIPFTVKNFIKYIKDNDSYMKTWSYGQLQRLSKNNNILEALQNLKTFDIIVNISLFKNEDYLQKINLDTKNKFGWSKVDFSKKENSSEKRNKNNKNRLNVINNISQKHIDYLKLKLKPDIDFYNKIMNCLYSEYFKKLEKKSTFIYDGYFETDTVNESTENTINENTVNESTENTINENTVNESTENTVNESTENTANESTENTVNENSKKIEINHITYNNIDIENIMILDNSNKYIFEYKTTFIDNNNFIIYGKSLIDNYPKKYNFGIKIDKNNISINVEINSEGTFTKHIKNTKNRIIKLKSKKTNEIPRRLIKTYKGNWLPFNMYKAILSFMYCNPGYDLYYYNDDDCRKFIKTNFDEDILDAYDSLIPGAYKSDIFRLAELYINGGIYTDISMACKNKLRFNDDIDLIIPKDLPCGTTYTIYNAFIAVKEKNNALMFILNGIAKSVLGKHAIKDMLSITGPGIVGTLLNKYRNKKDHELHNVGITKYNNYNIFIIEHKNSQIVCKNQILCHTKYENWKNDRKPGTHYASLFKKDLIYKTKIKNLPINDKKLTIFQTWETSWVSKKMANAIETFKTKNKCYNHAFYSDDMRREFILKNYNDDVLKAYDLLIPGAYKADLWRYCILNINGGIYIDADAVCLKSFKTLLEKIPTSIKYMSPRDVNSMHISNGFIYATANNPILIKCIEIATKKILNKEYPKYDVHLTGPGLLGNVIRDIYKMKKFELGKINKDIFLLKFVDRGLYFQKEKYLNFKYDGYDEERELMGGSNWANLFKYKKIYNK